MATLRFINACVGDHGPAFRDDPHLLGEFLVRRLLLPRLFRYWTT
jgi:hypothetical protein